MQGKIQYFSILDLFSGFHQVKLTPRAIEQSAFVTPFGQWEYTQMPFGLCNAPTAFQRMMQDILSDLIGKVCFVFVDDISIYTQTFDEHLQVLQEIFRRLKKNGLFLKPKKCTIASHEIHLLGHIVDRKGIRTDPQKIEAVVSFPIPKNKTDLRAFMGLVSYYCDFVAHFASHVDVLNKALKKSNDPFSFPRECQEAFQLIKDKLTSTPFLKRPDFTKEFSLHTDACSTGLGAILSQRNKHQQERVISYASHSTSPTERNYGATDLELLAVVWALKKY
jgi:hypothetical protein